MTHGADITSTLISKVSNLRETKVAVLSLCSLRLHLSRVNRVLGVEVQHVAFGGFFSRRTRRCDILKTKRSVLRRDFQFKQGR